MSNAATRVHHPYSPSTLQAREACPCWTPSGGTNEAAEAGTLQHDAAEKGLDDPRLSDAQAAAVAQCKAFCDDLASKFPGATVLNEQYLPVDDEVIWANDPPPLRSRSKFLGTTAGFMDWGLVTADGLHGELVDYKMGQHAVEEASNNLQGVSYALGLFKKYPTLRDVTVTFLLPYRDEVDQHTFDMTNALALLLRIKTVVHRAIEAKRAGDFLTARPSVSACSFCGELGRCPKVAELALHVGRKYRPIDVPKSLTPSMMLDPKDVGLGLQLAQVLKAWAEAYRAQATQKTILDDHFVPDGYKLVSSVKRHVLPGKARELANIAKEFLPEEQHDMVEALFDISLGPLEKLISAAAPRGSKEEAVETFGECILEAGAVEEGEPYAYLRMDTAGKPKTKNQKP
jgi:hypothetical protein